MPSRNLDECPRCDGTLLLDFDPDEGASCDRCGFRVGRVTPEADRLVYEHSDPLARVSYGGSIYDGTRTDQRVSAPRCECSPVAWNALVFGDFWQDWQAWLTSPGGRFAVYLAATTRREHR